MKKLFIPVFLVSFIGPVSADDSELGNALLDAAKSADSFNKIKDVGVIKPACVLCDEKAVNKSYILNSSEIKLETPYYIKKTEPYLINLKRTKDSPSKIKLTFKNSQKVCGKTVAYTLPSGGFEVACLVYVAQYIDEEIELDLKKLPPINDDSTEYFQIKLSKENIEKYKYNFEFSSLTNENLKIDSSSKFWGNGYNVKVEAKEK